MTKNSVCVTHILIFGVVRGVRGQKMAQKDKKSCLSHSVSQVAYIV